MQFNDADREENEKEVKLVRKLAKRINPVKIKPAIGKDEKFDFDKSLTKANEIDEQNKQIRKEQSEKRKQEFLERREERFKKLEENKQKYKEDGERSKEYREKIKEKKRVQNEKENERRKTILLEKEKKNNEATKIQKKFREKYGDKRNSIDNSDDKTVVEGTTPLTAQRQRNETSAIAILDKYENEADDVKLESLNNEDFIKLKGMSSVLRLPSNIKKLGAFRKYLKPTVKK